MRAPSPLRGALLAPAALLLVAFAPLPALAKGGEANTCRFALNAECDEPGVGTGRCRAGTDSWDCRRAGTWTSNACHWANDGECDEWGLGTDMCPGGSDRADCEKVHGRGYDPLRAFYGADDRVFVDSTQAPWRMIGRIDLASGGHCTGTVVGPRLVLTAAHCLYDDDGAEPVEPLAFVAGLQGTREAARARVVRSHVAPGFDSKRHSETNEIDGLDWAFLELDADVGAITGTMRVLRVTAADLRAAAAGGWPDLTQAGYSADSMSRLTAHEGCRIVSHFADETVFHECDTLQGDSGSPLFVRDGDGFAVVAVESATYPVPDAPFDDNMAVDARAFHAVWLRLVGGKEKR